MLAADWPRGPSRIVTHRHSGCGAWHFCFGRLYWSFAQRFVGWMFPPFPYPHTLHHLPCASCRCHVRHWRWETAPVRPASPSVQECHFLQPLHWTCLRCSVSPSAPLLLSLSVALQGCFSSCTSSQLGYSCEFPPIPFRVALTALTSSSAPKDPCSIPEETYSCLEAQRSSLYWPPS